MTPPEHWPAMARAWEQTGSPLRPGPEDTTAYQGFAQDWMDQHGTPRILLLGVTPEIYRLSWPAERDFLAVDQTPAMIDHVWPGRRDEVRRAEWLVLPLPAGSRDLAFCDGGLHLLDYPTGQNKLVERLHDVLARHGRCIFRLFVPPPAREAADSVLADLFAGRIGNLNLLKLRLGMALQESAEAGVAVREVWQKLRDHADDWESMALRLGWPLDHLQVIDTYRHSPARYHFISLAQAVDLFCRAKRFVYRGHRNPSYVLGERCPLVVFERR